MAARCRPIRISGPIRDLYLSCPCNFERVCVTDVRREDNIKIDSKEIGRGKSE